MSGEKANLSEEARKTPEPTGPVGPVAQTEPVSTASSVLGATGPGAPDLQTEAPGPEKLQRDMEVLRTELQDIKKKIERESFSAILAIGVFASVITFLSVQIQILANATNVYALGFLSFLTLAGLLSFLLLIFTLVYLPKKDYLWLIVTIIIIFLFGGAWWFSQKIPTTETKTVEELPTESILENQSASTSTIQTSSTEIKSGIE